MQRLFAAKWMTGYLMIILGLTLGGMYQPKAPRNFVPFRSMEHDLAKGGGEFVVNFLGNVVVFLPMGWLLPVLMGRWCSLAWVAGLSLGLSLVVEVCQGISGRRVADVDDLILNTLGGVFGYLLWLGVERLTRSSGPGDPES